MKNLQNELEEKLIQISPLFDKDNYQEISTEDIIDSLNDVSNQLQTMTGKSTLKELPYGIPREDAILMCVTLWKHMGMRLLEEIQLVNLKDASTKKGQSMANLTVEQQKELKSITKNLDSLEKYVVTKEYLNKLK